MWLNKNNVVCSVHFIYEVNAKWRLACFQPMIYLPDKLVDLEEVCCGMLAQKVVI